MSKRISRAMFLKGFAGAGLVAAGYKFLSDKEGHLNQIKWRLLGPSRELGHKLRSADFEGPAGRKIALTETRVLIVGGGIAGLSAGWWLKKNGFDEFKIIELEEQFGGNSAGGKNDISAFPWGAHYVPLANPESTYVRELFKELGIIASIDSAGQPVYNELFLCHDPQERLFKDGTFQEGLVPNRGLQPSERAEIARFFAKIADLRGQKGKDGKPYFAIPLDLSSQDEDLLALDRISMDEWLTRNRFTSRPLRWYINYCCRDDYGSSIENVSAWAGLHYFAGRNGRAANAEPNSVITWPEGNAYLVSRLCETLKGHLLSGTLAFKVRNDERMVTTQCINRTDNSLASFRSEAVIIAAPRFVAEHLVEVGSGGGNSRGDRQYAPWLVANISLRKLPCSRGDSIAWDNVNYYSDSLGYVVATHQNISTRDSETVITYYYPLSTGSPSSERARLISFDASYWLKVLVADLEKMHPGIVEDIKAVDFWPWGHGMIRPSVGYIWGEARRKMKEAVGSIYFAHSDMSGISNFEEAQYQGVETAKTILARLARV